VAVVETLAGTHFPCHKGCKNDANPDSDQSLQCQISGNESDGEGGRGFGHHVSRGHANQTAGRV